MDEVFGADNFVSVIVFYKTTGQASTILPQTKDFILWYARDRERLKFHQLYVEKVLDSAMEVYHRDGDDVTAWFLCTDYNDRVFHITQAFFPRTSAWDNLKRSLKGVYDDSLWQHLAGTTSAPFEAGEHHQIAVKVIDDRGNELMVVRNLDEAEKMKPPLKEEMKEWRAQPAVTRVTKRKVRKP